ncbi:MAG: hypothetical protein IH838_13435 [Proteobacteria bacterium]|nr:hypothetical protein [Pseudomonadota bacterium]
MKLYFVIFAIFVMSTNVFADRGEFEKAEDQQAVDVLPAELIKGEHHEVDAVVRSDGYLNYYTIKSDYGKFEAVSTAILRRRIGEINALAELEDLSQTEVFIKAAADAGVGQLKALKQFATNPIDTVVGIPSGIGRMFKRFGRQAGDAVEATKEFVASDDEDAADDEGGDGESTSDKAMGLTESFFGVSGAERAWSQKLGTDPYSTNEVLKAAIKEVAWAERLGRFGMGFSGVPEIPGADIIGEVNDAVWSKDPYELQDLNRARLIATGADEALIEEYLEHPNLSPSQQTLLTAAIAEIDGASGRDGILRQALNAESADEANFLIRSVTMLAWYHINQVPVTEVTTLAAIPTGFTADGTATLLFAIDHIYWTETIAEVAGNRAAPSPGHPNGVREIWLLGSASDRTRDELDKLGFEVHENVAAMMAAPVS